MPEKESSSEEEEESESEEESEDDAAKAKAKAKAATKPKAKPKAKKEESESEEEESEDDVAKAKAKAASKPKAKPKAKKEESESEEEESEDDAAKAKAKAKPKADSKAKAKAESGDSDDDDEETPKAKAKPKATAKAVENGGKGTGKTNVAAKPADSDAEDDEEETPEAKAGAKTTTKAAASNDDEEEEDDAEEAKADVKTTSQEVSQMKLKIDGIDYDQLVLDDELTEKVKTEIKKAVIEDAGNKIKESSLHVDLSKGSVVATIKLVEPTADKLKYSSTLMRSIGTKVAKVQGIGLVKNGPIVVSKTASEDPEAVEEDGQANKKTVKVAEPPDEDRKALFAQMDLDGDGLLSLEELEKAAASTVTSFQASAIKARTRPKAVKPPPRPVSNEDRDILLEIFSFMSRGSARFQASDAAVFLQGLGVSEPDKYALAEVIREQSDGGSDTLSKEEFVNWGGNYCYHNDPYEELVEIWRLVGGDRQGAGLVRLRDLQRTIENWGVRLSREELEEFCGGGDTINYDRFVQMLAGNSRKGIQ